MAVFGVGLTTTAGVAWLSVVIAGGAGVGLSVTLLARSAALLDDTVMTCCLAVT